MYSCGRLSIPITELIVYINKEYGFLFSVDEINNVVIKGRDADQRYYCYTENNDTIISLTGEYKNKLSLVCGQKTLYEYIDEYLISLDIEKESSKALILRFLYEMFTSNLEGYKLILQEKIDAIEVKSNNYTDKEKEIINNFLAWPDEGKDKAIYDLAGYSLEYCMMTNQKNTSLNIQNLKGKSFYIDTNVIYRALGLNSDNLKVRTHLFLSKFKEVGESLVISRPLKDALLINSQQINVRFALRYLQIFVPLRLKTCRLYDKQDLSPALIVQFVGRPTEPQTSLVSARRQD